MLEISTIKAPELHTTALIALALLESQSLVPNT